MNVQKLPKNKFVIALTEEEILHLEIIAINSDHQSVDNVPTLIDYLLTFIEQHWYDTVIEPELGPAQPSFAKPNQNAVDFERKKSNGH